MGVPVFEHSTCGRCGGSGKYSFNQIDGDRCYGCRGTGYKLTKRGRAAQDFLNAMRHAPATEIKVGDLILWDFFTLRFWAHVEAITPDTLNGGGRFDFHTTFKGAHYSMGNVPATKVTRGFSAEEKAAQVAKALEYQATLTKAGAPSKKG